MKSIILDTDVFIWWLTNDPELGKKALKEIADSKNSVYISAATSWEISIKVNSGKLTLTGPMQNLVRVVYQEGFYELPILLEHGNYAGQLSMIHRDPFDRMLIAQSLVEGYFLMTADDNIKKYSEVKVIDAHI